MKLVKISWPNLNLNIRIKYWNVSGSGSNPFFIPAHWNISILLQTGQTADYYAQDCSCCPSNLFLKLHNWYCHTFHKLQVLQELALLLFHLITLQYICFSSWSKWLSCALKSVTFTFMLVTYFHYIHNMHAEKNTYGIVSQFLASITRLGEQFK